VTSIQIVWSFAGVFALLAILCGAMAAHHHDEEAKRWDRR
jgi:uncharacterized membrane protein YgdD (TMEM256/DUF423 family)